MRALITLALAVVLSAASADACIHACKKFTETSIPGCKLSGKGCECLLAEDGAQEKSALMPKPEHHHHHHHGHKYEVTLTDPTTGVSGSSGYVEGKTTAGDDAVYQLFKSDRGCNCEAKPSLPSGKCTVSAKGCFFFQSSADVASKTTAFQLYAQVVSPKKSSEFTATAATKADIETAALQLFEQIVAFDASCTPTTAPASFFAYLQ